MYIFNIFTCTFQEALMVGVLMHVMDATNRCNISECTTDNRSKEQNMVLKPCFSKLWIDLFRVVFPPRTPLNGKPRFINCLLKMYLNSIDVCLPSMHCVMCLFMLSYIFRIWQVWLSEFLSIAQYWMTVLWWVNYDHLYVTNLMSKKLNISKEKCKII